MPGEAAVQTWAAGDFGRIAAWTQIVAEQLCEAAGISGGHRVLDVATGTGNTAIAAARRQCAVTAIDCVDSLLDHARKRADIERLSVCFEIGDAEALQFKDASFDAVLSTFGVMFAESHTRAAAELVRVCRPGGCIALANWTPAGFVGKLFEIADRYSSQRLLPSPMLWGDEDYVATLFAGHASRIHIARRTFWFRHVSAEAWLYDIRRWYGPTKRLFDLVSEHDGRSLADDILALVSASNTASDRTLAVPAAYLEVIMTRE